MSDFILDLPDSEFMKHEYSPEEGTLRIFITLWNAQKICVSFKEAIGFWIIPIHDCIGMRTAEMDSEFCTLALMGVYEKIPKDHGFQCYEFWNLDDMPFVKVVARAYEVIQEI